jgi:biopolymer transport protein ExbB
MMNHLFKTTLLRALLATAAVCTTGAIVRAEDAKPAKGDVSPWWDSKWPTRKKVTIDLSDKGVAIAEPVGTTAVLVRLHDGNFNFLAAKEDGSDLRFVADDGKTALKHHIEKWDTLLNEGYVWVQVPEIKPSAAVNIWLYYGNTADVTPPVAAKETFDADTTLVYHFADTISAASDSSASGVKAEGVPAPAAGSLVSGGLRLLGQTAFTLPAAPQLDWAAGGAVTVSAWIKASALAPKAVIFSRSEGASSFVIGLDNGVPYVEMNKQRSSAGEPVALNAWKHLAVVVSNSTASVYLDGKMYGSLNAALPALKGPAFVGKDGAAGTTVGFSGELDELQIARVARPVGFLRFAAINQGTSTDAQKLLLIGEDLASGHEGGGHDVIAEHLTLIKDISKDLTIDGWVVIILCALLAIIGWAVALGKLFYLNKIGKATAAFLPRWKKLSADLGVIDHGDEESVKMLGGAASPKAHRIMRHSPLYHIYHIGSDEIRNRLENVRQLSLGSKVKTTPGLSGRSITAIKATLHTGLVREVEKLNSKLVFLTIGIAGGPYLGLLGTVIGVMITFAVIAKTGEVEVNSIAPGIAGALLATVAGLAVAIPALFAYSYLSARIKQAVNDMETFIDEFLARMAEHYPEVKD